MMKRSLLFVLLMLFAGGVTLADCKGVHRLDHVILYGTSEDPDVFLWDDRTKMRDYEDGSFDQQNMLLPHARLLSPGTRAIVELCISNYVEPNYMKSPVDAIGVLIITGPMRGRYGWISSGDIRTVVRGMPRTGPGE